MKKCYLFVVFAMATLFTACNNEFLNVELECRTR